MAQKTNLIEEVQRIFGFDSFKGNQEAIINNVLAGNDTFVLMPTGGGKSLCYQCPALLMEGTAIVISPLISLMKNQVDALRATSNDDSIAHFLNSSLTKDAIEEVKNDVSLGKTKVLYMAPESLNKAENTEFLRNIKISFYAIDEAHCISEWGHDFRPEYSRIREIINQIGAAPVIALTATATPKVQRDIQRSLQMKNPTVYKSSFNRPNLYYEVRPKTESIDKEILKFIKENRGKSGIIYCLSRQKVEDLAQFLVDNDVTALPYHAGLESTQRSENQDKFLMEKVDVIVATIAFGMGIDKPDVRYVIHYDIPKSLEGYYQETGRAGRDGGEGKCIAFYSKKDLLKLEKFTNSKPVNEQEIGRQLLAETAAYAESSICRRKLLLHYFGEEYTTENCGNCDNCLHPKVRVDAAELLQTVIELIITTKEKYKADIIVDTLAGKETVDTKQFELTELELFNSVTEKEKEMLPAVIRQAQLDKYLDKEIESYGVLKVTEKGHKFLKKPTEFYITKDNEFSETIAPTEGASALDDILFSILKNLRRDVATKHNLQPWVIFSDQSLEMMATYFPCSIENLAKVPTIGENKAKRYGEPFVEQIKKYVIEEGIEPPENFQIKRQNVKAQLTQDICNAIDLHIMLDDFAISRNISFDDLLTEIEIRIINFGMRFNIDYFLEEAMEPEDVEEIYDYFKNEATSDNIKEAQQALGEDEFDEESIRLVRIKFLSELSN